MFVNSFALLVIRGSRVMTILTQPVEIIMQYGGEISKENLTTYFSLHEVTKIEIQHESGLLNIYK